MSAMGQSTAIADFSELPDVICGARPEGAALHECALRPGHDGNCRCHCGAWFTIEPVVRWPLGVLEANEKRAAISGAERANGEQWTSPGSARSPLPPKSDVAASASPASPAGSTAHRPHDPRCGYPQDGVVAVANCWCEEREQTPDPIDPLDSIDFLPDED
jgi:hypothetical protein